MVVSPGGVAHDNVDLAAYPAVEEGEEMPVLFLQEAFPAGAGTRVDAFGAGGVVEAGQHVC